MDPMTRLAFKMKLHGLKIPVVYQCALLVGVLQRNGKNATIESGFIIFGDVACKHYWVKCEGNNLDIGTKLGQLYSPHLACVPVQLVYELDESIKRVDLESEENKKISMESEIHYDLYNKDPKEFWKQKPRTLRNFKA